MTNILSHFKEEGLLNWIDLVGEEESNRIKRVAGTRGTQFHHLVESYLNNNPNLYDGIMPDVKAIFWKCRKYLDMIDDIEYIELFLYSEILGAAGTTDVVAKYEGERAIIDMKSARKPKSADFITAYFEQTTAYSIMFEDLTGERINKIVIIIGVDTDDAQVFVRDRRDYETSLRRKIEEFKNVSN